MNIEEIYKQYNIMPKLQLHMMRVAAVSKIISDSLRVQIDTDNIVKAMLLHDMGNILKFKLTLYPQFVEPNGLAYWQQVQDAYIEKYGKDEHIATEIIAKKLNVSERVFDLLRAVGFTKSKENLGTTDLGKKICCYSDQRVTPFGVTDLQSRLAEGRKRFMVNKGIARDEAFEEGSLNLSEIEKQIFANSTLQPDKVDDAKVNVILESNYLMSLQF